MTVTLWQFYEQHGSTEEEALFGPILARVHDALLDYRGALPRLSVELEDVGRILRDRSRLARLRDEDHEFLVRTHADLAAAVPASSSGDRPLHGSPHSGNWLSGPGGPLLLDFETPCRGPVEWDLSAHGEAALDAFPRVHLQLLAFLRRMRSL